MKLYIIQTSSTSVNLDGTGHEDTSIDSTVYATKEEAIKAIAQADEVHYYPESYALYELDTETMDIGEITYNLPTKKKKRVKK